ncbi:RBBP9/YdeN family alpha/beta hydrolase [Staphylococcus epidermidis]
MTDIIIVHSKHGNSKNHWYEWLRHNLTLEGYDVSLFNLEANDHVQIDEWVNEMKQQLHIRKKDTYFVTHGFGSIAALKFLEETHHHIEGFFSIAGFKEDAQDIDEDVDLKGVTIDYDKIKEQVDKFYGLTSKDDQYVSYKETQRLMNSLNGHTRVVEDGGHFLEEEGFVTFTSLINRMQGYMTR